MWRGWGGAPPGVCRKRRRILNVRPIRVKEAVLRMCRFEKKIKLHSTSDAALPVTYRGGRRRKRCV